MNASLDPCTCEMSEACEPGSRGGQAGWQNIDSGASSEQWRQLKHPTALWVSILWLALLSYGAHLLS